MINKEEEDSIEYYEIKEKNQILITQETSSEESNQIKMNQMIKRNVMVFVHAVINQ